MAQTIVPISDISADADWVPNTGSDIWDAINADDPANHWVLADDTDGAAFTVGLDTLRCPEAGTVTIRVKYHAAIVTGFDAPAYGLLQCSLSGSGATTEFSKAAQINFGGSTQTETFTFSADEIDRLVGGCNQALAGNALETALQLTFTVSSADGSGSFLPYGPYDPVDPLATMDFTLYYLELSTPDAFTFSVSPAGGPTAGGSSVTISARGWGSFYTLGGTSGSPYQELAFQNGGDYQVASNVVVVDDDTITCDTPAVTGSNGPGQIFLISEYPAGEAPYSEALWVFELDLEPEGFTDSFWTWGTPTTPITQIIPRVYSSVAFATTSDLVGFHGGPGAAVFGGYGIPMPCSGTFKNLCLYDAIGFPTSLSVALRKNGSDTSLVASLAAGAAGRENQDTSNTVAFSEGDLVGYHFAAGGGQGFPGTYLAATIESDSDYLVFGLPPQQGRINAGISNGVYGGALGNGQNQQYGGSPSAHSNFYSICGIDCTMTNLCMKRFASPAGGSFTAVIILNGVIQDGSGGTVDTQCLIDDTDPDFLNASFELPLVVGDIVEILYYRLTTDSAFDINGQVSVGVAIVPTTPGAQMFCGGTNDTISASTTTWKWNASEQNGSTQGKHTAITGVTGFNLTGAIFQRGAPGVGTSFTHTVLNNGVATDITGTISNNDTEADVTATENFEDGDPITIEIVPTNNPNGNSRFHWVLSAFGPAPASLELDDDVAFGDLEISGDMDFASSHQVTMSPDTTTAAIGGVVLAGRTQFQFLRAGVPSEQRGNQWRLQAFLFKYRAEETA